MFANRFVHYELRTTDPTEARGFYQQVLGAVLWATGCSLSQLPERAAAQGAPAHWLGHIAVDDVEGSVARWLAMGAERLGPPASASSPSTRIVLRDPFGAVMALTPSSPARAAIASPAVVWHQLHARDHEQAFAGYAREFGWAGREVLELGVERSTFQGFAWSDSQPAVGSVADLARLPHIHTAWLFFFRVGDLDEAVAKVRALGGTTVGPFDMPGGARAVICDDPQGAAFALHSVPG